MSTSQDSLRTPLFESKKGRIAFLIAFAVSICGACFGLFIKIEGAVLQAALNIATWISVVWLIKSCNISFKHSLNGYWSYFVPFLVGVNFSPDLSKFLDSENAIYGAVLSFVLFFSTIYLNGKLRNNRIRLEKNHRNMCIAVFAVVFFVGAHLLKNLVGGVLLEYATYVSFLAIFVFFVFFDFKFRKKRNESVNIGNLAVLGCLFWMMIFLSTLHLAMLFLA